MKPIIKWAGGKTQLLPYINEILPKSYNKYFEPFIGGGALLFSKRPSKATINDINSELINLYRQIQNNPENLVEFLGKLDKNHENSSDSKIYFYDIRDEFNNNLNTNTAEQAARLVYINKHCFNGLYRVNSKGLFNVPFNGKKKGKSFDKENIMEMSKYLKEVDISLGDFEESIARAEKGDFVFFDSPYVPLNPTSFTDYTKEGFEYDDHVRLANLYKSLTKKGVYCMLTNHNTDLVKELYKDFNIRVVQVARNINSKASNRKGEEVIITNYDL